MSVLLVRNIGELCTCDPEVGDAPGVLRNAAVAVRNGRVMFAGPERDLGDVQLGVDVEEIDARGAAVIPGLVDAHTHLVWLGDRSDEYAQRAAGATYESIAAAGGGIRATVRATAAGTLDELVAAARERAQRALRSGTTTLEIKSGYGLDHAAEMRQLDAAAAMTADADVPDVVSTYLPLHALPEGDRAAFLDDVCTRGITGAAGRARFADAFCETGAYSVDECARLMQAASDAGLGLKLHTEQRTRTGGALLAARAGAVSADHLEHATDEDLHALAHAGVVAVVLPGASLVLGGPPPPGRRALDAGATVAVATDCNPGTCYSESMPLMLSLAVATAGMTPAEALTAATSGGAAACSLDDRGVLRSGMRADLVVLDTPHWIDVAYHLGAGIVRDVVLAGRRVTPSLSATP